MGHYFLDTQYIVDGYGMNRNRVQTEWLKHYNTAAETSYTPKEDINLSLRYCVGKPENWKIFVDSTVRPKSVVHFFTVSMSLKLNKTSWTICNIVNATEFLSYDIFIKKMLRAILYYNRPRSRQTRIQIQSDQDLNQQCIFLHYYH